MMKSKWGVLAGGVLVIILLVAYLVFQNYYPNWSGKDDLKVGLISEEGIGLVSISPERRMINILKIGKEVKLWVPYGYGWYLSNRVDKLLKTESKTELMPFVFFYNFGFWPDKIVWVDRLDEWQNISKFGVNMGIENYVKMRMLVGNMLYHEEIEEKTIEDNVGLMEMLPRDFADSRLVGEEYRLTLKNSSGSSGLASWLATRIEAAGVAVVGLETGENYDEKCVIMANN